MFSSRLGSWSVFCTFYSFPSFFTIVYLNSCNAIFFHCAYANTQIALSCCEVDEFSEIPFPPLSGNFSSYEIQGWVLLSRHFAVAYTVGRERAGWAQALPSLLGFCHTRAHALKLERHPSPVDPG